MVGLADNFTRPVMCWECELRSPIARARRHYHDSRPSTGSVIRDIEKVCALHELALNLLRCKNRVVARESATMFYSSNTFNIETYQSWDTLYSFLQMIGEVNRNQLRSLVVRTRYPETVSVYSDGVYTTDGSTWYCREVLGSDEALLCQTPGSIGNKGYKTVARLRPAISACFRLLGRTGPRLKLVLALDKDYLPDICTVTRGNPFNVTQVQLSMEELAMEIMSEPSKAARVEVVWTCQLRIDWFERHRSTIESRGWEIMDVDSDDVKMREHKPRATITMRKLK